MRELSFEQELVSLRDQIARIRSTGCPETYRLPERGWLLVHQALIRATEQAGGPSGHEVAVDPAIDLAHGPDFRA